MRARRAVALGCLTLAIGAAAGAIMVQIVWGAPFLPAAFGFGPAAMAGFIVMGLSWASIGAFLVIRRPENAVGLLLVICGAGYALTMFFAALAFTFAAQGTDRGDRLAELAGWAALFANQVGAFGFLILFIFPTGRAQSPVWAWFTRLAGLMMLVVSVIVLTQPGPLHITPSLNNPFSIGPDLRGGQPFSPLVTLFTLIAAAAIPLTLATRYQTAGHAERQQLKWFALAGVVSIAGVGFAGWGAMLSGGSPGEIGLVVYSFGAAFLAIAIAIAILRHNLYDIDRIVSRTIAYALITAVLAGVFGVAALSLGVVLSTVAEGQTIAVAGSTLLVAALFGPLRRRAQAIVDRRFDRSRYDAALTVQGMTVRLRDDVDLDRVEADVLGVIDRTFHPATAGLWLR